MFCNSCGSPLPDDSIFCNKCGARQETAPVRSSGTVIKGSLVKNTQPEPAKPVLRSYTPPEPIPAYNPQPNIPVYSAPEIILPYKQDPVVPRPSKKKRLTWLWILLSAIAVAGIIVGILLATDVLGGQKYSFVETIDYHSYSEFEASYTIHVELNSNGFPETITKQYENLPYSEITELRYDRHNNVIFKEIYRLSADGERADREAVDYNEYGHILRQISYTQDGPNVTVEYERTYDRNGNLTECITNRNGTETQQQVWEYDKKGNVTDYTNCLNGEKSARYKYEYDKQGNLTSRRITDYIRSEYSAEYTYENEYEGKLLVETVCYKDDEKYSTTTFEYDKKGHLTEEKIKYSNGDQLLYEYEYDDDGNMIEQSYSGGSSYRYTYEYDDNGNMSECSYYYDDELRYCMEVTYFDKAWKLSDAQILLLEELKLINVQKKDLSDSFVFFRF